MAMGKQPKLWILKNVVWMKADENEHGKAHGASTLHKKPQATVESWEQEKCRLQQEHTNWVSNTSAQPWKHTYP